LAIVYRVENWEGFGPYSPIAPTVSPDLELRPEPDFNELTVFLADWVFGFDSLTALSSWFSSDVIESLSRDGEHWLISRYELHDARVDRGKLQLVFDKEQAELLGCFPLSELLQLNGASAETLMDQFEAHEPCVAHPQHSAFAEDLKSGIHTEEERRAIIDACFENFVLGSYYRINSRWYGYRVDGLQPIGEGRRCEAIDPRELRPTARFVEPVRPPGTRPPKRDPRWTMGKSLETLELI